MSYLNNYYQEPTERQKRRGIVAEVETSWGTYTIREKNGKVWIEAYGWGGAERKMPKVNSVEEAKEIVWERTKPASTPDDEIIRF